MPAIETSGLTKVFHGKTRIPGVRDGTDPVTAVQDLDLTVNRGEVFGFLGPNGAGKSTTINMLLDYVRPTAGTATVLDRDAQEAAVSIHDDIGVLPEQLSHWERLTAREHVSIAADTKDVTVAPARALQRVRLSDAADRTVSEFSTGMRQRLGLAMALVGEPDLLILDEPTAGLDPNGVQRLRDIITAEVDRGATVFFSSHVLQEVEAVCDRVGILRDGNLVAVDTVEGLRAEAGQGIELRVRLGGSSERIVTAVENVAGVTDVACQGDVMVTTCRDESVKIDVLNAVQDSGGTVEDFDVETANLTTLFGKYATESGDSTDDSPTTERADLDGADEVNR